jgi:hypothetical protein
MDRLLTPQQELFLSYYTNPKSETFSNATQSAVKAGYTESYADNITTLMPDWLLENIGDMKRLKRAEKNLSEVQEMEVVDQEGKVDVQLLDKRIKVDFFVAERLNKGKYSTQKSIDVTSGGKAINQLKELSDDELIKIATSETGVSEKGTSEETPA